jgi:hypothetical protein
MEHNAVVIKTMQAHCRLPATSPLASALQSRTGFNPPTLTGHPELGLSSSASIEALFFTASIRLTSLDTFDRGRLITVGQKPFDQQMQFLRQDRLQQHMERCLAHGRNGFGRGVAADQHRGNLQTQLVT